MDLNGVFTLIISVLVTVSCLYGMIMKKASFWGPENVTGDKSSVSFRNMLNPMLYSLFGKWGVIIFNVTILVIWWILVVNRYFF